MICPVCNVDMIVVEHCSIELDYCVECLGIWFDEGELSLLMESLEPEVGGGKWSSSFRPPQAPPEEKPRRCPLCRKKMKKVLIGREPGVLIDRCPEGEGLWFDGGELGRMVKGWASEAPGGEERILSFLGGFLKGPAEQEGEGKPLAHPEKNENHHLAG